MNTTIFPATIAGKIHAAFVMDYRTDEWATMCGRQVTDPDTVQHRAGTEVTCRKCSDALAPRTAEAPPSDERDASESNH